MSSRSTSRLRRLAMLGAAIATLFLLGAAPALAGPLLRLDTLANSTAAPGGTEAYYLQLRNTGDAFADPGVQPVVLSGQLPAGLTVSAAQASDADCSATEPGTGSLSCQFLGGIDASAASHVVVVFADVASGAPLGPSLASFEASGGGAPTVQDAAGVLITPDPPSFGLAAFDTGLSADPAGAAFTQAAGHPFAQSTDIEFNLFHHPDPTKGDLRPVEPARDVDVDLPPGFLGAPTPFSQCTIGQLANSDSVEAKPLCPPESQLGTTDLSVNPGAPGPFLFGPVPVFNMVPPPGAPARLGFNIAGTLVVIDVSLRSDGDYGLTARARNISEGLALAGSSLTLWGVPAAPVHFPDRACPGEEAPFRGGHSCVSNTAEFPFLRGQTSCTAPGVGLAATARADSWFHPGAWAQRTSVSHAAPGYPLPPGPEQGIEGCDRVPFDPSLSVAPSTDSADSPTGLDLHLRVPQGCWAAGEAASICQSDLRDAELTLPQGMTLNPSAADGLAACTPEQVGLTTPVGQAAPIHFDENPVACPDTAKIGKVEIATPALKEPLDGSVYLAQQSQNPFGSLLAMYLVAEGSGVVVKQAGEIEIGPGGRLTTIFRDAPQTPFSVLHVDLFGGPRAALRTPPTCGTFAVTSTLTPWSGNAAAHPASGFEIDNCPNSGFDPHLSAGTTNPLAGSYSPFNLRLTREDGTQELAGLTAALPQGLIGRPAGIPYCPDTTLAAISADLGTGAAQEASPSCPTASQVGTVTAGAGAGPNPFYASAGRAYLAGPYKGAPLSLAVVTPAVAGPFDLGSVLVRNALRLDPETAQITAVSDPIPTALHGVGLDLRDVRVDLNRDRFTLNPTSCDEMAIEATIASAQGQSVNRSERFQVAGCDRLGFKPKLSFRLKGKVRRTANPSLIATLKARPGDANLARAQVKLPPSAFLDNSHIGTICTRPQFAANTCPPASIYGKASATSPILDYPLYGKVYLRSSEHQLPDLVVALKGPDSQPIEVDLAGKTDSVKGALRNTFELIPDAPVDTFRLRLFGGAKGLIQMSSGFCSHPRASVKLDGQNGKTYDTTPVVRAACGKRPAKRGKGGRR